MRANYVLVVSNQDPAGATMIRYLHDDLGFAPSHDKKDPPGSFTCPRYHDLKLHVSSNNLLYLENLDQSYPDATAFIFLSKHKSDSKIPTLTCHCTGNFGDNPHGGKPFEIAISYPALQKRYLQALTSARSRVPDYDVIIEATHHGPTSLAKPLLFVELGSSEKQWSDTNAASVICDVLLGVLENVIEPCERVGLAFGGTHYPTKFNKLLLESEFGLAAIASKHSLERIDAQMLDQMTSKSIEKVTNVILDPKGLGIHKERITKLAESSGLEVTQV